MRTAAPQPQRSPIREALLVIFGAGASHDSVDAQISPPDRIPRRRYEDFQPPLAKDLFDNRLNFLQLLETLRDARVMAGRIREATATGRGVEQVLDELSERANHDDDEMRHRQLIAVRFYLQRALSECGEQWAKAVSNVTNYLRFIDRIRDWQRRTQGQVLLVTFNYDRLLEMACADALRWVIGDISDYAANPSWKLFKLHGSVDWGRPVADRPPRGISEADALEYVLGDARRSLSHAATAPYVKLGGPQVLAEAHIFVPAVAIPLQRKAFFECPDDHLQSLEAALPRVGRTIVVGWRAAEAHFMGRFIGKIEFNAPLQVVDKGKDGCDTVVRNLQNGLGLTAAPDCFDEGFSAYLRTQRLEQFLGSA